MRVEKWKGRRRNRREGDTWTDNI